MRALEGRQLRLRDCPNARDLGGLPAAGGRRTRFGSVVRSGTPERLGPDGWEALAAHGIRTVIDLRNPDERGADAAPRPGGMSTVHIPLDGVEHADFWREWSRGPQFGTPLYFRPHLERFPERSARVLAAVARAEPGGVLVHCVTGRDRTGQVAMLLLSLAGVSPEAIAADYARSTDARDGAAIERFLAERGTSAREALLATLSTLDPEERLRAGGLGEHDIAALRERMLEPGAAGG